MPVDAASPTLRPNANRAPSAAEPTPDRRRRTGPHSRAINRGAIGGLNGNSAEAKFIKSYEAMLVAHCGGNPSAVQRALIIRAARLAVHLELWDRKTIPNGGALTATGHHHYLAWSNALGRTLARLGLEAPAAKPIDPMAALREHIARRRAEAAA
jgi:hypothetical protein